MEKILLCYAPKGGNVEKIAKKFSLLVGIDKMDSHLIESIDDNLKKKIATYNKFIMVISTVGRSNWDSHYTKIGWDLLIQELREMNLEGKTIAIIGLGDHLLYPDNFVDSMGILHEVLIERKAELVGYTSTKGYEFSNSLAVQNDNFVGLVIDQDNEGELTDSRLKNWFEQIKDKFGL